MERWSLQFESPDLGSWVWLAAMVLAAGELIRYILIGRRPQSLTARAIVALAAGVPLLVLALSFRGAVAAAYPWPVVALGLLVSAGLVRAYRQTTRPISVGARRALLAVRLLATTVACLALARPVLQYVRVSRERAVLGIAIDDSRSMSVRDVARGDRPNTSSPISRTEAVDRAVSAGGEVIDALAAELDLRWFTFAAQVREVASPSLAAEGEYTALAASVERVQAMLDQTGRKLAGVVIVSDGRDNLSADEDRESAGQSLAAAGVPLYAVGVGSETPAGQNRSLRARRIDCPGGVAVLNRLPVQAEFLSAGLADVPIQVELLFDDEIVDRKEVKPTQPNELLRVELAHTPTAGGLHRVTMRARAEGIDGPQGEAALSQFVRVTDEKIQVLYIDRARYERAAIARALEAASELRVTKIDLNRPAGSAASPLLPRTAELQAFHVVLIGDVDRSTFPQATLSALRDLVMQQGRGLAMLGGFRTLGGGGYQGSPLDGLLPVNLGKTGMLSGPVDFELTPQGRTHSVAQLARPPARVDDVWKLLPPLDGAGRLTGLSPAAEVLLRTSTGEPLLVVAEAGKGRTAAVAFDSTWRWSFASEKGVDAQRRYWRQLALWLANRRPDVWVSSDRPRYELARLRSGVEKLLLRAGVTDPTTGKAPENVVLAGVLTGPGGKPREIRWVKSGDVLEANPAITEAGEYRVKVTARVGDRSLGESEAAFVIVAPDPEMADPNADLEALRRLAARTQAAGGEYAPIDQFNRLLEKIGSKKHAAEVMHVRRENLVDDRPWAWLAAFVGLITLEWVIRRRAGLV